MAKVIIEADTSLPEDLESLKRFFGNGPVTVKMKVDTEDLKQAIDEVNEEQETEEPKGVTPDPTVKVVANFKNEEPVTEQVLDSKGVPWDERIHASTKTTTKDGRWKKLRGIAERHRDEIEDEIRLGYEEKPVEGTDETPKEETPTKDEPKKEQVKTDTEDAPNLQKMDLPGVLSFIELQVETDPESRSLHTNLLIALKKLMNINNGELRDPVTKYMNTFKKANGNLCVSPRDLQPCDIPKVTAWIREAAESNGDE